MKPQVKKDSLSRSPETRDAPQASGRLGKSLKKGSPDVSPDRPAGLAKPKPKKKPKIKNSDDEDYEKNSSGGDAPIKKNKVSFIYCRMVA